MNFLLTAAVFAFTPPGPVEWRDEHYSRVLSNAGMTAYDEKPHPLLPTWGPTDYLAQVPTVPIRDLQLSGLTIGCGDGSIYIDLKTGAVTFRNCDPDEAARQFWWRVMQAFPGVRSAILAGVKP